MLRGRGGVGGYLQKGQTELLEGRHGEEVQRKRIRREQHHKSTTQVLIEKYSNCFFHYSIF